LRILELRFLHRSLHLHTPTTFLKNYQHPHGRSPIPPCPMDAQP
jgi:hypothetical protein